jgi:hypothetical protein
VFGRRWGARAEALREEVRAKLAAHAHERAMLTEALTKLESRMASDLEQHAEMRASTAAAMDALQDSATGHANDLGKAVQEVARICAMLADRIETEREERRALVEAVTLLARQAMESRNVVELTSSKPRVIGGRMDATPTPSGDHEIVLIDEPSNGRGDEPRVAVGTAVRLRFGDGWIDGLEVCEVVGDDQIVRYRLRRALDQYVLPARFERRDLELVADSTQPNQGKWWQS